MEVESGEVLSFGTKRTRNKRLKLQEEEDRISALPDSLIHHILSFLPSTKEAIQTCVLSKQWQNQWTRVPVLIFYSCGTSDENFSKLIDNTLIQYDCSKVKKFQIQDNRCLNQDPQLPVRIRFATNKHVEELILDFDFDEASKLPRFLFNNASLVKLETTYCEFMPNERVNWRSLKTLNIERSRLTDQTIKDVLSGSLSLESLELKNCVEFNQLVIASKSLKRLVLSDLCFSDIEILCPNLKELHLWNLNDGNDTFLDEAIEKALCACPVLESLEIINFCKFKELVIASTSLKRLVIGGIYKIDVIETSCPNLEELKLSGVLNFTASELTNLPSVNSATLEFEPLVAIEEGTQQNLVKEILLQLQHVKELNFGWPLIEILSALEVGGVSCPLNNKRLTLDCVDFDKHPAAVAYVLRNSIVLVELVLTVSPHWFSNTAGLPELNDFGENYWKSNESSFNCFVSHLKIVKIIRLSKRDEKCRLVLNFIEFLLKNAQVLEKLVVEISEKRGTKFAFNVSEELLSFPRGSRNVIVELLYS